jgi:heme/copper-type cytochrome/quinol oxidase subunit 2
MLLSLLLLAPTSPGGPQPTPTDPAAYANATDPANALLIMMAVLLLLVGVIVITIGVLSARANDRAAATSFAAQEEGDSPTGSAPSG